MARIEDSIDRRKYFEDVSNLDDTIVEHSENIPDETDGNDNGENGLTRTSQRSANESVDSLAFSYLSSTKVTSSVSDSKVTSTDINYIKKSQLKIKYNTILNGQPLEPDLYDNDDSIGVEFENEDMDEYLFCDLNPAEEAYYALLESSVGEIQDEFESFQRRCNLLPQDIKQTVDILKILPHCDKLIFPSIHRLHQILGTLPNVWYIKITM
uniref:Uncharacterized protein n=1 Tax=Romanomermis culicivorax TaxID=13658 RepID=A0A915JIV1_ROMCU